MIRLLLLALLGMSALTAVSQDTIILEGQILNDSIDKANLTIVNISMQRGTITTRSGQFSIEARRNDTINISAVQYESRQFIVNETMFKRGKISLYLIPKVTTLDQVNISNINLTGDIRKDIGSTTYERKITPTDLGIPENTAPPRTVEERRYHTAVSSAGGFPLDGLINSITGRLKMLKKHIEVSRFEKLVQESRYQFSDSIYMNELNIEKEYIEDFVYYIFEDPEAKELVDANNALGLLDFMIKKSAVYKSLMNQE